MINVWIDCRRLHALLTYLLMLMSCVIAILHTYKENSQYWLMVYGEQGPTAEITLLIIIFLVTFWMRQILFPRNSNDSDRPTRNISAFRSFWIFSFGVFLYYIFVIQRQAYREPTPIYYYIFWCIPMVTFLSWAFEVVWAVSTSYYPPYLRRILPDNSDDSMLQGFAERLQRDTQDLVWTMGTITFFFFAIFGEFYLGTSYIITIGVVVVVLLVSIFPWLGGYRRACELLEQRITRMDDLIDDCQKRQNQQEFRSDQWKACAEELSDQIAEIERLRSLLSQFHIAAWLEQRRKDLIPVAVLNLLGPAIGFPGVEFIASLLGSNHGG